VKKFSFKTEGVCTKQIDFSIEDEKLHDVKFHGGCPGNTAAISKLLEGYDAKEAVKILKGNICGHKRTSCADQLAIAVEKCLSR